MNILIPIHGKMTARQFLNEYTYSIFKEYGFNVIPLLSSPKESFPYRTSEIRYFEDVIKIIPKISKVLTIGRSLAVEERVANWRKKIYFHDSISGAVFSGNIWFIQMLYAMAPRNQSLYQILSKIEQLYFSTKNELKRLLSDIDIVLNPGIGSLGYAAFNPIIYYALSRNVPTISYIPNYDNLSVRGFRAFCPDVVCVWGKSMKTEAEQIQKIPSERIKNTGSTLYDYYYAYLKKLKTANSNRKLMRKYGLDSQKKTILYAFGENSFGNIKLSVHVIENLLDYNIIIRTHPSPKLSSREFLNAIQILVDRSPASIYVSNAAENLSIRDGTGTNDINELIEILFLSDVVISHFSTISLEACIFGKQVIEVDYDEFAYDPRRSRIAHLPHNSDPMRAKAVTTVSTVEDVFILIENLMQGNGISKSKIKDYVYHVCGCIDGDATKRLCKEINILYSKRYSR